MLKIARRQDLHDFVSEVMSGTYERLLRGERFEVGQAMLKSYVIERHPRGEDPLMSAGERCRFLRQAVTPADGTVDETSDARLFLLDVPTNNDSEVASFVVDMMDDRYWLVHTAAPTSATDPFVERLVAKEDFFDAAWLPGRFLSEFTQLGRLFKVNIRFSDQKLQASVPIGRHQYGLSVGREEGVGYFSASPSESATPDAEEHIGQSVSLSLRDHVHLREGLDDLDQTRYLKNAINVTRADVRYHWDGVAEEFSNARIYNWGKVTGSGNSAGAHLTLLSKLVAQYRRRIEHIESALGIGVSGGRAIGQPVSIVYSRVERFEPFVFNLFAGTLPFRLTGIPQFRRRDYAIVSALDLHSRQPLRFEITPEYMTIALRKGACGNSIARLYTNLLQHLDAGASIHGGSRDERLF